MLRRRDALRKLSERDRDAKEGKTSLTGNAHIAGSPKEPSPESARPVKDRTDTTTMQVQMERQRARVAFEVPFLRMIERTGRVLDDATKKEWLDDAEQRLRAVISRIDPIPVSYGYIVERDADGLTIRTVTPLKVAKNAIGLLSSGEWPCWNEIIEAVPEFDMTVVVFDAVSRREWWRRWDMGLQLHRIQLEHGIFA